MPTAGQAGTQGNVRTGAHKVTVGGTAVGYTEGSLTLSPNTQFRKRFVAEWGTNPIATLVTGVQPVVTVRLAERTLAVLDVLLTGIHPGLATANSRGIGRSGIIGSDSFGKSVVLHPIAESGTGRDITIHNAMPIWTGDVELSDQGDQIYTMELHANVKDTRTDGDTMISIGETTA